MNTQALSRDQYDLLFEDLVKQQARGRDKAETPGLGQDARDLANSSVAAAGEVIDRLAALRLHHQPVSELGLTADVVGKLRAYLRRELEYLGRAEKLLGSDPSHYVRTGRTNVFGHVVMVLNAAEKENEKSAGGLASAQVMAIVRELGRHRDEASAIAASSLFNSFTRGRREAFQSAIRLLNDANRDDKLTNTISAAGLAELRATLQAHLAEATVAVKTSSRPAGREGSDNGRVSGHQQAIAIIENVFAGRPAAAPVEPNHAAELNKLRDAAAADQSQVSGLEHDLERARARAAGLAAGIASLLETTRARDVEASAIYKATGGPFAGGRTSVLANVVSSLTAILTEDEPS